MKFVYIISLLLCCAESFTRWVVPATSGWNSRNFKVTSSVNELAKVDCVDQGSVRVALTRERGENSKLEEQLAGFQCIEIPCIAFAKTDMATALLSSVAKYDTTIITSPQAASVYLETWKAVGMPSVRVATVGKGTSQPLLEQGIVPMFEPSEATGDALASELPIEYGPRILYPASALADNKIVTRLEARGFQVSRINTYTTIPTSWTPDTIQLARTIDIVTFASPSAVKNWATHIGTLAVVVAIGPTTAEAARKAGFSDVHSPKEGSRGLESWAALVREIASRQF